MRTTNAIERLHEEFKRRIKTQTVLPSADTAAMLFWALLASGQINMREAFSSTQGTSSNGTLQSHNVDGNARSETDMFLITVCNFLFGGNVDDLGGRTRGKPERYRRGFGVTQGMPRIAIISTTVPPGATGQARVLGHLIGNPPPENFLLLTENSPFPRSMEPDGSSTNYRVFGQLGIRWHETGWLKENMPDLNSLAGMLNSIRARAREISRYVQEFNAKVMVACTASPFDLPACTVVALRRRLPLITYLFDDPIFQWVPIPMRKFARLWEPIWSRLAAEVIVPNEAMAEEFFKRRRRRPVIVRNPVAPEAFASSERPWPTNAGQLRIIYTGSVYHAQSDAFINLLAALERLKDWSLHIYTDQSEVQLAAYGIQGPKVFRHEHVDQGEAYARQRSADVLFLPLAFRSQIQEVLRTSAP